MIHTIALLDFFTYHCITVFANTYPALAILDATLSADGDCVRAAASRAALTAEAVLWLKCSPQWILPLFTRS